MLRYWRAAARTDSHTDGRHALGGSGRLATIERDGHLWFSYVGAAGDVALGTAVFGPYVRASAIAVELGAARDAGNDVLGLRFGRTERREVEATLGTTLRRPGAARRRGC